MLIDLGKYQAQIEEPFYPILLDSKNNAYINVVDFFSKIFEYQATCKDKKCQIQSQPPGTTINIDFNANSAEIITASNKQEVSLAPGSFIVNDQGQIWLRSDQLDKLLPLKSNWDVNNFILSIQTDLPINSVLKKKRDANNQHILKKQQLSSLTATHISQSPITPTDNYNANLFYQLTDNEAVSGPSTNVSNRTAQFNGLADLFGGTLQAAGTLSQPKTGPIPYSWNYTLANQPYFKQLQVGDINTDSSPFLGSYSLENAVSFNRLQEKSAALTFTYQGQTMPGTEIDVWRNDTYLVGVYYADSNGQYNIIDYNASSGDVYKLQFYFTDGTQNVKYVKFTPNQGLLLNPGQVDADASYGVLTPGTLKYGNVGSTLFRYGLARGLTVGLGTYYMNFDPNVVDSPLPAANLFNYADIVWQAFESLSIRLDKMLGGQGYAASMVSTYFPNNYIQALYRDLPSDSPLLLVPNSLQSATAPRMLQINDIYLISNWRVTNTLIGTDASREYDLSLNRYFNDFFSPSVTGGIIQNIGSSSQITSSFQNTSHVTQNGFFTLGWSWTRAGGTTSSAQYVYNIAKYSLSAGMTHSNVDGSNTPTLTANWRINSYWTLGASYQNSGAMLSVIFNDALSLFSKINAPQDYAMGSISGVVLTSKALGLQKPVEGAVVSVGGKRATTNANGAFAISGIQPNETQYLEILPDSVDASLAPEVDKMPIYFRPGTHIEYNPILTSSTGIDGYVLSDDSLPSGLTMTAIPENGSGYARSGDVMDDGFFVIERLPPGKYKLSLLGLKDPPPPYELTVSKNQEWISNIFVKWHYTEPPPTPLAPVKTSENVITKPSQPATSPSSTVEASDAISEQVANLVLMNIFDYDNIFVSPVNPFSVPKGLNFCSMASLPPIIVPAPKPKPSVNQQIDSLVQGVFAQEKTSAHS